MKTPSTLQRGMACLNCRKKKTRCDGARPFCTPCSRSKRPSDCQYHEKKQISRAETLQHKITKLEVRLKELESEQEDGTTPEAISPVDPYASYPQTGYFDIRPTSSTSSPYSSVLRLTPNLSAASTSPELPGTVLVAPPDHLDDVHIPPSEANWWEDNDTFCRNKQILLNIFFSHRHQCGFDVHLSKFQASLTRGSPCKPHPVLTDAIFLLACLFSRSPLLSGLQPYFLDRALQGIRSALERPEQVVNVLQASCLLAVYFFCHGRVLEGYYHCSTAARLAMTVGLHQLQPFERFDDRVRQGVGVPMTGVDVLSSPKDNLEYAERLAAFWQVFSIDRAWSVATGLPPALPDDDHPWASIDAAWPVPIPEAAFTVPGHDLYSFHEDLSATGWSTVTLRAKAVMLFERTARFAAHAAQGDIDRTMHRALDVSLSQFSASLPGVVVRDPMGLSNTQDVEMMSIHTLIYAATIQLHRALADIEPKSSEQFITAANGIVCIIDQLQDDDYDYLDPIVSTCWNNAADVYLQVLSAPFPQLSQDSIDLVEQQLSSLVAAMKRLSSLFPVAGMHATKVEQQKAQSLFALQTSFAGTERDCFDWISSDAGLDFADILLPTHPEPLSHLSVPLLSI